MAVELNDLVHVYDNVLSNSACDFLISLFENSSDKHERVDADGCPNFTQFNLTANSEMSEEVQNAHSYLISKTLEYRKIYYDYVDDRCFPLNHSFEQYRIKKYNNDGNDVFDTHVDVADHASARRFLSFFWYLNDVEEGGETVFNTMTIQPRTGRLVVFPPLWMFPHRGNVPISNAKYLLSTYLHYK